MSHAKILLLAMRETGGNFKALTKAMGVTPDQVKWAAKFLVDKGFVRRVRPGVITMTAQGRKLLEARDDLWNFGPTAARPRGGNTLRARLWRALFNRKRAQLRDLLSLAIRDEDQKAARQDACVRDDNYTCASVTTTPGRLE